MNGTTNGTMGHEPAENYCASTRRSTGRIHLPVAPRALARIRFSPEKPLPRALTPDQALNWLEYLEAQGQPIKVVNVNGPGDPLATPELTLMTLNLVREKYPDVSMCLTTLGFGAVELASQLAEPGLAHVSIQMDAVDPEVVQKIYAWIRPGKRTLPPAEAARLLILEQAASAVALKAQGVQVQIRTTVYPGVNDEHIAAIAAKAAEIGAAEMKLFPFLPASEDTPRPKGEIGPEQLADLAGEAARFLPAQAIDLAACRQVVSFDLNDVAVAGAALPKPTKERPNLAVCSSDGFEVDLHLGQTDQYLIYGPKDGPVLLLGSRPAPEPGGGDSRWQRAALTLCDCFAVLAAAAGETPKRLLAEKGLPVITQEGNVEGLVDSLFGGGKKKGKGGGK